MKHPFSLTLFLSFVLLSASVNMAFGQKTLPEATVVDVLGNDVNIAAYVKNGKPALVTLWATWCGPCRMELNEIKSHYGKWKTEYGLEVVAINVDVPSMATRAIKMFETNEWNYTFMHDKNQELLTALKIQSIPYSVLIDGQGNIKSVQTGFYSGYAKDIETKLKNLK